MRKLTILKSPLIGATTTWPDWATKSPEELTLEDEEDEEVELELDDELELPVLEFEDDVEPEE